MEAIAIKDINQQIQTLSIASFSTSKEGAKAIDSQIKKLNRQRDRLIATRIRREAGLT